MINSIQLLENQLKSFSNEQLISVYKELSGMESIPVDIDTFINDPYYLGDFYYPDGDDGVYAIWRENLQEIFPSPYYSNYNEVVILGAVGSGKTTCGRIGYLYDLYLTLNLKNPQALNRLRYGTPIVFYIYSSTIGLSNSIFYNELIEIVEGSSYFKGKLDQAKCDRQNKDYLFPNRISFRVGSRALHSHGAAIHSAILDEANFEIINQQMVDNYNELVSRRESRFMGVGGQVPGHFWLMSQRGKTGSEFLEEHVENQKNNPNTLIINSSLWEAKKDEGIYSGETFDVFVGDELHDPFIFDLGSNTNNIDPVFIMNVPIEFRQAFENNLAESIKNIGGIRTRSSEKRMFNSIDVMKKAFKIRNFFTQEIVQLDFYDEKDQLVDYFDLEDYLKYTNKNKPHFIHVDTGITGDRFGIACSVIDGYKVISRINQDNLKEYTTKEPLIKVEWIVALEKKQGQEIPLYKTRVFIIDALRKKANVNIVLVTSDGFQSRDMRQIIRLHGVKDDYLTTDKEAGRPLCISFRNGVMEERVELPFHRLLYDEIDNIRDGGKGYDHPKKMKGGKKGSKDLFDSVVGSYNNAITYKITGSDMVISISEVFKKKEEKLNAYQIVQNQLWERV